MTREEMEEERRECREFVLENIDYERLKQNYPFDVKCIDGYVGLLTETLCDERPYIRIGQREFGVNEVRERLLQINYEHICYVHECMRNTSTKIINIRAYTLTALFNAPLTIDQYYNNLAAHDLAEDRGDCDEYSGYGGYRRGQYRYGRQVG